LLSFDPAMDEWFLPSESCNVMRVLLLLLLFSALLLLLKLIIY